MGTGGSVAPVLMSECPLTACSFSKVCVRLVGMELGRYQLLLFSAIFLLHYFIESPLFAIVGLRVGVSQIAFVVSSLGGNRRW